MAGLFKAPSQVRPARQPAGLARTHQRRAHQPGGGRLHERRPGAGRAAEPGQDHRHAADPQPRLVPRLGVRGGAAPGRGARPLCAHRAHDRRSGHAAGGAGRDDQHPAPHRDEPASAATPGRWCPWSRTAPSAPWSAASTTRTTSSTAPPMPAASPAPRSSSTSTPRRSRTACNPRSMVRDYGGACGNWSPKNYSGGSSGRSLAAIDAFRMSLNVPAVNVSLQVGREKVVEMTQRLGVVGVKKTCSMALGDTGITPLQHTGAYAHFANGGKTARPYGILEMFNSKGDLIYSRDRDEPPPVQVVSRKVVEDMNQMMLAVVTNGTAQKAALDFTTVGRQDRHQLELSRRLVRRLHRRAGDRRVGRLRRLPPDARHHRRQPAGAGLAQLHVGRAQELPHHSADPGARPASQPGGRAAAAQRAQADRPRDGAGADRPGRAEDDQHHARPDAGGAEEGRRDHAAGRRGAADARQRTPAGADAARPARGAESATARAEGEAAGGGAGAACRGARRRRAHAAVSGPRRGDGSLSLIANILINLAAVRRARRRRRPRLGVVHDRGGLAPVDAQLRALDDLERGRASGRRSLHARAHGAQRAAAARLDAGDHLPGQGRQPRRTAAVGLRVRHRHGRPRRRGLVEPRRLRRPGRADPEPRRALRLQQRQRHARAGRPGDHHAGARRAARQLAADRRQQGQPGPDRAGRCLGRSGARGQRQGRCLPIQRLACR